MEYLSSEYGKLNFPSPCSDHTPSLLPSIPLNIIEDESLISTEENMHSNFPESLCNILGLLEWSLLINPSSINNWQPLHTPRDRVSSRSKKFSSAFLAMELKINEPAHPFADPRTSEFENPPTATKS